MNDPVIAARARGLLRCTAWIAAAACSADPTLEIQVHHPDGFAPTQTVVTVYSGGDISCDQIAFGDRSDAELAALAGDAVDVTHGGSATVSRLGGKAIAARGFDDQHRFITGGCKDLGEIAGDTALAIATQPTATVAIDPGQPDRPFSERTILVTMTDARGAALDGLVSWQLSGPAGAAEQPASPGVATRAGDAKIHVEDIGTPGPEGLRIRVPWATAPLPLVTGFDLSHASSIDLGGGAIASHPSCDVRRYAGQPSTLVCLTQANAQLHRDAVEIAWQTDHFAATPIAIPGINNQFALFVDHDGSAKEPVYVLSSNPTGASNWYKLGAASGTTALFDDAVQNVIYIPRCKDNAVTALVAVQTGAVGSQNKLQLFTPAGAPVTAAQDGEVLSGGCVADVDGIDHQAVVVSGAAGDAALVLITGGGASQAIIPGTRLTGSGFVAAQTQGATENRFAGTRLQATGTVVFEAVLAPEAGSFKLVERREHEAAGPPSKILGGKLDRDGDTDLIWDIALGPRRRVIQVSLAKRVAGVPLTAITSGPLAATTATASDFLTGDLDGRGSDETVLFSQSTVTIFSPDE
jgi:hypothetical protein